jgi:hypothetical protein
MHHVSRIIDFVCLLALTALLSGCASAMYGSGKDGDVLCKGTDRAVIVQRFGEPIRRGTDEYGRVYEVFRAKGKIVPAQEDVGTYKLGEALTLGVGDIIWTPVEVVRSPFLAAGDKDVLVVFDQNGKYLYHTVQHAKSE